MLTAFYQQIPISLQPHALKYLFELAGFFLLFHTDRRLFGSLFIFDAEYETERLIALCCGVGDIEMVCANHVFQFVDIRLAALGVLEQTTSASAIDVTGLPAFFSSARIRRRSS